MEAVSLGALVVTERGVDPTLDALWADKVPLAMPPPPALPDRRAAAPYCIPAAPTAFLSRPLFHMLLRA